MTPPRFLVIPPRRRSFRPAFISRGGVPGRALVLFLLGVLVGCDGSNLFQTGTPLPPPASGEGFRAQVLRFFEEGTQLFDDEVPLRFRWDLGDPRLQFDPGVPDRERLAFLRALAELESVGAPPIPVVATGGTIRVEAFPADEYRLLDPTRPWSFSRTFVTATPQVGITEVEILLSLELGQAELERASLHAMGHAVGIMGHPAFSGDLHVMAARSEGGQVPTFLAPVEREAIRFLYTQGVRPGMTRPEIRDEFQSFFTSGGS
jgi:hypothetical protein